MDSHREGLNGGVAGFALGSPQGFRDEAGAQDEHAAGKSTAQESATGNILDVHAVSFAAW